MQALANWLNVIGQGLGLIGFLWLALGAWRTYMKHAGRIVRGQAIQKTAARRLAEGEPGPEVEAWANKQYREQDCIPDTVYADQAWMRSHTIVDIVSGQLRDLLGGAGVAALGLLVSLVGGILQLLAG